MAVQLVIEDFEGAKTVVPLGDGEITIGRREGNTIQLTEKNVSRTHARLRPVDDGWQLEDLQSYNGVRLNGELIEGASLIHEGDLIQIGDYQLTLGEEEAGLKATVDLSPSGTLAAANSGTAPAPSLQAVEEIDPAARRARQVTPRDPAPAVPATAVAVPAPGTGPQSALPYDDFDEPQKKSRAGLVIAGLLLAGVGVGVYLWQQSQAANDGPVDGAAGGVAAATADAAGPGDAQPESGGADAGGEPATAGSAVAGEGDAGAAGLDGEPTAGTESDGELADDGEEEEDYSDDGVEFIDEPTLAPGGKTSGGTKKRRAKPKKSASALLEEARKAQLAGRYSSAYSLAKKAYAAKSSQEAAQVMGVAACKMGDASKAKNALSKLSGGKKSALKSVCAAAGINL